MFVCCCPYLCSIMPAVPFALEQQVAIAAVRRACALTTTIFNKLVAGETLVKGDKSPVTGAP
jgi:3'(2'), 5'-bisphosphate nucleotidase